MNCKKGDLAIVVLGNHSDLGKIVKCLRVASSSETCNGNVMHIIDGRVWWRIDKELFVKPDNLESLRLPIFPDSFLKPIRDNDGEDESLSWADVPRKVSA